MFNKNQHTHTCLTALFCEAGPAEIENRLGVAVFRPEAVISWSLAYMVDPLVDLIFLLLSSGQR